MILITKDEAMHLQEKGYKWGNVLHKSHSSGHKYYITEKQSAIKDLADYRNSKVSGGANAY